MKLELEGKHVFIAGASRGIGLGMAHAFAREGAKVALTARGAGALDEAKAALVAEGAKPENLLTIAGDMTASADIAAALEAAEAKLGPVHCAIANVGLSRAPLGFDVSDEDWDADMKQNLFGSVYLAREAIRRILARPAPERQGANVILISSVAGVDAMGTALTYAASKAGINHFTRQLAKFTGKENIRVNAIAPGNILFDGGVWDKNTKERPEAWERWIKREVALRRFGTVEEIADAALFLASPRASFITGEVLVVDGGQVR
ncbi:SDR family NAD(P)-dependent oxidoreductase [Parvibaculum sp.]|uniref:SDR family NAD(P)-dependent oxidoreductase n=1 Tax=Parvibaculum sp. TaxID=2024848 RepID=UPI002731997A|nr:SDR family oxidoreductase [Parvibaculum sp.]MDP1626517.1 SDR family oxidoreductase [Parvibaculum sp.]MDP2150439.1 SDR family oxidoreductase [Parvibaculum sp.]MDP3328461.1 SDR family oxidoreductase [Parvibaculum sp.]